MRIRFVLSVLPLVLTFSAMACGDDDATTNGTDASVDAGALDGTTNDAALGACSVATDATYPSADFATNAAPATALLNQFEALLAPMKAAELDLTVKPTATQLQGLFAAGTPSLQSGTAPGFLSLINTGFARFEAAAGQSWAPANPPAGPGGRYGAYIFDASGVDLRQSMEKGMFGALHYRLATQWIAADTTGSAAVVDQAITLFGANPTWPKNDKAGDAGVPQPDKYTAIYAKRRDNGTDSGIYTAMRRSAVVARALSGNPACAAERKTALDQFRLNWERTLAATSIFYFADASKKFQTAASGGSSADFAAALHGYNEAVAFLRGFRENDAPHVITDADIQNILSGVLAPVDAPSTGYLYVTDTAAHVAKLEAAIPKIAAVYGFTSAQVNEFKVSR